MKGNDTQSDKEIKLSLDCTSAATFGIWHFFSWSRALFTRAANIKKKCKFCSKTGSYNTINTFKNYFITVFSVISGIQTNHDQFNTSITLINKFKKKKNIYIYIYKSI